MAPTRSVAATDLRYFTERSAAEGRDTGAKPIGERLVFTYRHLLARLRASAQAINEHSENEPLLASLLSDSFSGDLYSGMHGLPVFQGSGLEQGQYPRD